MVCLDGFVEVSIGVNVAGEHGFELRRGEVDALVEHRVEVFPVLGRVGGDCAFFRRIMGFFQQRLTSVIAVKKIMCDWAAGKFSLSLFVLSSANG